MTCSSAPRTVSTRCFSGAVNQPGVTVWVTHTFRLPNTGWRNLPRSSATTWERLMGLLDARPAVAGGRLGARALCPRAVGTDGLLTAIGLMSRSST